MAHVAQPRPVASSANLPRLARAFAYHAAGLERALLLRGIRGYRIERSFSPRTGNVLVRLVFEPEFAFDWNAEARRFAMDWLIAAGFYTALVAGSSLTVTAIRLTGYYGDSAALGLPEIPAPPASGVFLTASRAA
jgi:hypothetical protein